MNFEQVQDFLLELFSSFILYPSLINEIKAEISRTGYEERFKTVLKKQLYILSLLGINAKDTAEFEFIGNDLYSMHIAGRGFNYRILYFFLPQQQPVLLLGFSERAGKTRTDYSSHIPIALTRKAEMEDEFK